MTSASMSTPSAGRHPAQLDRPRVSPGIPGRSGRHHPSKLHISKILARVLVILVLILQVYPFLWIVMTSLRSNDDFASSNAFSIPTQLTLDNFQRAIAEGNIAQNILNSAIVTIGACLLLVICGMTAAYAIQVLGFKGSGLMRGLFLLGIVVPVQVALVPLFLDYSRIGVLDTLPAIMIPLAGFALPMSLFLFLSFFEYIPKELYEAASIDGAGPYRIFFRITLPMSVNTIVTVVMVNAIFIWNDFIFANTFILSEGLKTIPLGLQSYIGAMGNTDWTATFAAVSITVTPLLLVFLVLNRAMIYGLESGASKG